MNWYRYIFIVLFWLGPGHSHGHSTFYNNDEIETIKIYFNQTNWDHLLDSLYVEGEEGRLLAKVTINGVEFDSVGVRYKGFSSVSVDRAKNPFNIKLDYVKDQAYNDIDKLKLSNVIQDPSFVREVLSYEIARKYMPASEANFAKVYINDIFWGVYSNVESVNKEFLRKNFGSTESPFFKANPESLDLNGENCNLSTSLGEDSMDYDGTYELKSDYGWTEFYEFIDTLNNQKDHVGDVLNVDQTLWMHAFNYALINFDSYIGYAQNYYLYQDNHGLFNPILWDLNQSFGSFRLTDASGFFRGFSVDDAKTIDPLTHLNSISVHARPLLRNLFENDTFKRMYLAHLRTIFIENVENGLYKSRAQELQDLIDEDVSKDTNKFYTYDDFRDNLTSTVTDLVSYPGLVDLMDNRWEYIQTIPGILDAPEISNVEISTADSFAIAVSVEGATRVFLYTRANTLERFVPVVMYDDGQHDDGGPEDGIFGCKVSNANENLDYYIYAENDISGSFSPERAAKEYYTYRGEKPLVINEVLASNKSKGADQNGESDDWIELYNNTNNVIDLSGYLLSDDALNTSKWSIGDTFLMPDSYIVIWADGDEEQSGLHANFKLSSSGEHVFLSDREGNLIDEASFGAQNQDISWGRYPNGTGQFAFLEPTIGAYNSEMVTPLDPEEPLPEVIVFPNPAQNQVTVKLDPDVYVKLVVLDLFGRTMIEQEIDSEQSVLTTAHLSKGSYYVQLTASDSRSNVCKLILN